MRVLHVAPSVARSYGGPTHSLHGYVRATHAAGAIVDVFAPSCEPSDLLDEPRPEPNDRRLFPSFGRDAFVASPALWSALAREGHRYDVVHVHGLFNPISSIAARIAITKGWPLVIRPFGTLSAYTFEHRRRALKRVFFALLDGPNLRRVQAVHFTTDGEQANAEWHGIPLGDRAFVIPPPFTPTPALHAAVTGSPRPLILCLSRLNRVKAIETLLAALPAVIAEVPGTRLVIAGDGDPQYAAELRALTSRLSLGDHVEFTGFVSGEQKARLLARATVFALPSFHENFGLALLEALGAGLPAVITPEVQLAGFVERHGLGVITTREPAALAASLVHVLRDTALQARCRASSPALVADTFSDGAIGTQLVRMYESAISRS